jgi:hemolysin III
MVQGGTGNRTLECPSKFEPARRMSEDSTLPQVDETPTPTWRGRLHQIAFLVSVPAVVALVAAAPPGAARVATVVYGLSLIGVFGVSAMYHRFPWSPLGKRRMKRLDHSMIFVLIAGTYTPLSLLVLDGAWSVVTLSLVWGGAAVGIALKLVRIDGLQAVSGALYIVMGWGALLVLPEMIRDLSVPALVLVLAGGIFYTTGAVILALRRPDPAPRVFGYHEVWHALTLGASSCHYAAVLLMVLAVR